MLQSAAFIIQELVYVNISLPTTRWEKREIPGVPRCRWPNSPRPQGYRRWHVCHWWHKTR